MHIGLSLHQTLAASRASESREYSRRCSNGVTTCPRKLWYLRNGAEAAPRSGRMGLILDDGHYTEDQTLKIATAAGFTIHSQQELVAVPACNMVGHFDAVMQAPGELLKFLFEHKNINHFTFERWEKGNDWPEDYVYQTCAYMIGTGLNRGCLFIRNKNTGAYLEYWFERHHGGFVCVAAFTTRNGEDGAAPMAIPEVRESDVVSRFNALHEAAEAAEAPPRMYRLGADWQCSYCPYAGPCWGEAIPEDGDESQAPDELLPTINAMKMETVMRLEKEKEAKGHGKIEGEIKGIILDYMEREGLRYFIVDEKTVYYIEAKPVSVDSGIEISAPKLKSVSLSTWRKNGKSHYIG